MVTRLGLGVAAGLLLVGLVTPLVAPLDVPNTAPFTQADLVPFTPNLPAAAPNLAPAAQPFAFSEAPQGPDAWVNLLANLQRDGVPTPEGVGKRVREFVQAVGFDVPGDGDGDGIFEENSTISYSYDLGDVTGDGTDDVALDTFCLSNDGCIQRPPPVTDPLNHANYIRGGAVCGYPHRVEVVSGVDGSEVWTRRLDDPRRIDEAGVAFPVGSCAQEFVVGTVPLPGDRHGLLVYRFVVVRVPLSASLRVEHEYYLLDPLDGQKTWHYAKEGFLAADVFNAYLHAENLYLQPILQVPPTGGVDLVPSATQPALFLQGVGFDATFASTGIPLPGHTGAYPLLDWYQPNEWAVRIEPATGEVMWTQATFGTDASRSVLPSALTVPPPFDRLRSALALGEFASRWYWYRVPCCFDLSGDSVPDLVYWTREWSTTPSSNLEGPYMQDVRLVVRDGETGGPLYDFLVYEDHPLERSACFLVLLPSCILVYPQLLGDANGDGASDLLLHTLEYGWDYHHGLRVYNGRDGAELWRLERATNVDALVLGDADGDGGNDFVTYEWHNSGFWFWSADGYSAANVTMTPLTVRRGLDGATLWTSTTIMAPIDLRVLFDTYRVNGVPDLDGDGVGELVVDDPLYYPDQTVVHRFRFLSGRTGAPVYAFATVGAFAFPAYAGDLNRDGIHELAVLNGDVNDLWLTTFDGQSGEAQWSRRILTMRNSNYVSAIARFRTQPLETNDTAPPALLVNLHLRVTSRGGAVSTSPNTPQLAAFEGPTGLSDWSIPVLPEADYSTVVRGATPLSTAFAEAYADPPDPHPLSLEGKSGAARVGLGLGAFIAASLLGFAATQVRRWFA